MGCNAALGIGLAILKNALQRQKNSSGKSLYWKVILHCVLCVSHMLPGQNFQVSFALPSGLWNTASRGFPCKRTETKDLKNKLLCQSWKKSVIWSQCNIMWSSNALTRAVLIFLWQSIKKKQKQKKSGSNSLLQCLCLSTVYANMPETELSLNWHMPQVTSAIAKDTGTH